jgi:hypothetical protein
MSDRSEPAEAVLIGLGSRVCYYDRLLYGK